MITQLLFTYDFYIGWTDELKDGKIQVKIFEHGAEVIFSLIIEKDFSWCLFFRKRLVNSACSILRSTPSELDSGTYSIIMAVHNCNYLQYNIGRELTSTYTCITDSYTLFYSFKSQKSHGNNLCS